MPMKFRAHDTFFIRKGMLSKGMQLCGYKPDGIYCTRREPYGCAWNWCKHG